MNITFTLKPQVKAYIAKPDSGGSNLAFECWIGNHITYQTYQFDIEWFINDAKMITNKTKIEYLWLKRDGTLYIEDWNKQFTTKIGFHVRLSLIHFSYCSLPYFALISLK